MVPARHPAPKLFRGDKRQIRAPAPSAAAVLQWLPFETLAQSSNWASDWENRRGEGVLIRPALHLRLFFGYLGLVIYKPIQSALYLRQSWHKNNRYQFNKL